MNFFSKFDICGLIMANALSMIIRINGNLFIIFSGREQVKEYQNDICSFKDENGRLRSRPQNVQYYFKEGFFMTMNPY